MRTLVLLRHAKSDYPAGVADIDRPLAPRGARDAAAAAWWLRTGYPVIDEVVVSPAVRAQQTWGYVATAVEAGSVRTDDRIYVDWGERLLAVVAELDPGSHTALIVGHNPGIEELARSLAGGWSPARDRLEVKFPTSGIAVLRFTGSWSDAGSTELVMFAVPRGE